MTLPGPAAARTPRPTFNLLVLALCHTLFNFANILVSSTAGLVGTALAPSPYLVTVSLGAQFVGTMLCTFPASMLMEKVGRRRGFIIGTTLGMASGGMAAWAIVHASFPVFCLSGALYGGFAAFGQYIRFAAVDAAEAAPGGSNEALRARAIAFVMTGGVVAALVGPRAARMTIEMMSPILFAGCYLAIVAVACAMAAIFLLLDLLRPPRETGPAGRSARQIIASPDVRVAFLVSFVAYFSMNLLMTATPLAMLACGLDFDDTTLVIEWHALGMFVPSFFTGRLIARFGVRRILLAGVAINVLAVACSFTGETVASFVAGLLLLGVGWNFMFTSGTTMFTACYGPSEKAVAQGVHDLLLFAFVGISSSLAGALNHWLGWIGTNLLVLPLLLAVVVMAFGRPQTSGRRG